MIRYDYGPGNYDLGKLDAEVRALQPPLSGYEYANGTGPIGQPATTAYLFFDAALTPADKGRLDGVVAAHDGRPRRARPLWSIRADVQALTAAQWGNVWADLSAPVAGQAPRKYLMDYGVNAGPIFVFDWSLYVSGPTAAQQKAGQISLTALYVQDNPTFLVKPPFDPSINVPGDEPVS